MNGKMWIDIKTKRDVRLFLWMVGNDVAIENYRQTKEIKTYHLNHIYGEDYNLATLAINEAFRILYKDSDELISYAYRFKKAKEALLPIKEFGWFKRNNDACYFAWAYIRVFSKKIVLWQTLVEMTHFLFIPEHLIIALLELNIQ